METRTKTRCNGHRLERYRLVLVRRTPGVKKWILHRVSNPVSAFAYLADDGRQELDSLSSDVQVRISSTRYDCLRRVPVVSFLYHGIFLPHVGASPVYILCVCITVVHTGTSDGMHRRLNIHTRTHAYICTRARARARSQVRVEEPLMNLPVFFRPPVCVVGRVSSARREG